MQAWLRVTIASYKKKQTQTTTVFGRGQKSKQCVKTFKNWIKNKIANITILLHKPIVHPNLDFCLHFWPLLRKQTSQTVIRRLEELVWNSFHRGHNSLKLGSSVWERKDGGSICNSMCSTEKVNEEWHSPFTKLFTKCMVHLLLVAGSKQARGRNFFVQCIAEMWSSLSQGVVSANRLQGFKMLFNKILGIKMQLGLLKTMSSA